MIVVKSCIERIFFFAKLEEKNKRRRKRKNKLTSSVLYFFSFFCQVVERVGEISNPSTEFDALCSNKPRIQVSHLVKEHLNH